MAPGRRFLFSVLGVAVAVSVVHDVDNTVDYADHPQAEPGSMLPNPPDWLVGSGWFVFTAFGALGLWYFVHDRLVPAAISLAVYSGSGLVGIAHYLVPGATDTPWWRQAHVVADIVCGALLFAFALARAQAFASVPRYSSITFGSFMSCLPLAV